MVNLAGAPAPTTATSAASFGSPALLPKGPGIAMINTWPSNGVGTLPSPDRCSKMRAPSLVAATLLLCSCFLLPQRSSDEIPPAPSVEPRVVASKEAPTSLLTADGSRCLVGAEKFAKTTIGDRVWCMWHDKKPRTTAASFNGHGNPSGRPKSPFTGTPPRNPR